MCPDPTLEPRSGRKPTKQRWRPVAIVAQNVLRRTFALIIQRPGSFEASIAARLLCPYLPGG